MPDPSNAPAAPRPGRLLLIPNTLDLGCVSGEAPAPDLREVLPLGAIRAAAGLTHWVAENAKTTRAFLKRVGEIEPLAAPLQAQHIAELPRPPKGGGKPDATTAARELATLLAPAVQGHDVGLMSEAGLPGVADPGAAVVRAAHQLGLQVLPLSGPSSLVLALAASGLQGQSFAFVGYLPVDGSQRAQRLRELEQQSRKAQQTQLVIETPYRNPALWQALVAHLQPQTWLSVSCGLTLAQGFSHSDTVARWRDRTLALPTDVPAVFSFLAS
ncbi:MAG: SAM-dependent methyltransferase [Proteobacteria bacterium]|uniref:SAM-dependent methyltransferase n=1 Tax=Aquabacterium sp. TaxID=1872578 RepID=UPI0035C677CD|nr:SAM-dependent methyltransferase [Pseudomonadota bacterium]